MAVATEPEIKHISIDEEGVAWIVDANTKVIEVVRDCQSGMRREEIHDQYPDLSVSQIHAALAYYYDYRAALDADMDRRYRLVDVNGKGGGTIGFAATAAC